METTKPGPVSGCWGLWTSSGGDLEEEGSCAVHHVGWPLSGQTLHRGLGLVQRVSVGGPTSSEVS